MFNKLKYIILILSLILFTNTVKSEDNIPKHMNVIVKVNWFCSDLESTTNVTNLLSQEKYEQFNILLDKYVSEHKCYKSEDWVHLPGNSKCLTPEKWFKDPSGVSGYWCIKELRLPTMNWIFKMYTPLKFLNLEKS